MIFSHGRPFKLSLKPINSCSIHIPTCQSNLRFLAFDTVYYVRVDQDKHLGYCVRKVINNKTKLLVLIKLLTIKRDCSTFSEPTIISHLHERVASLGTLCNGAVVEPTFAFIIYWRHTFSQAVLLLSILPLSLLSICHVPFVQGSSCTISVFRFLPLSALSPVTILFLVLLWCLQLVNWLVGVLQTFSAEFQD